MCRFIIVQQPRYAAINNNNNNDKSSNDVALNNNDHHYYPPKKINSEKVQHDNDEKFRKFHRSDSCNSADSGVDTDDEFFIQDAAAEVEKKELPKEKEGDSLKDSAESKEWSQEQKRQQRRNFGYFRQKSYRKCSKPTAECFKIGFQIAVALAAQEMDFEENYEEIQKQWKIKLTEKLKLILSEEDFCNGYHKCHQPQISRKFLSGNKKLREIKSEYEEQKFLNESSEEEDDDDDDEMFLDDLINNLSREMSNLKTGVTQILENYVGLECIRKGGVNNVRRGYNLLRQAASEELPMALYNLGVLCDRGHGLKSPKPLFAFKCFERASELRHSGAKYNLAVYYAKGRAVKANKSKAKKLMYEAACGGLPQARAIVFNKKH